MVYWVNWVRSISDLSVGVYGSILKDIEGLTRILREPFDIIYFVVLMPQLISFCQFDFLAVGN